MRKKKNTIIYRSDRHAVLSNKTKKKKKDGLSLFSISWNSLIVLKEKITNI